MLPQKYNANRYPLQRGNAYKITDIKPTNYGFRIKRMSDYVSHENIKLTVLDNGFSYAVVKVDTNYRTPYEYKLYFDNNGDEIISIDNSDAKEKRMWLELQK